MSVRASVLALAPLVFLSAPGFSAGDPMPSLRGTLKDGGIAAPAAAAAPANAIHADGITGALREERLHPRALNGQVGDQPASTEEPVKPLLGLLESREALADTSGLRLVEPAPSGASLLDTSIEARRSSGSDTDQTKALMGKIDMPYGFGSMSVVSQEYDEFGRVTDVKFFDIQNPNSKWDMDVDVDDGAVLQFKRSWGGSPGKRPFKNKEKARLTLPGE